MTDSRRAPEADGRTHAVSQARAHFDDGGFRAELARRIAIPSTSQEPDHRPALSSYLRDEMTPYLEALGFVCRIADNPVMQGVPFLLAERIEDPTLPTVLTYGHGDTVRGQETRWRDGLSPWTLTTEGERWYGRGTADNKAQHSINLAALACVLTARQGRLGYNVKILLETGEEVGSPGLRELCRDQRAALAADLLLASDGPRLSPGEPTLYMGSCGVINFTLRLSLREGGHHSGNWGGALANPGVILAHALTELVGPRGEIRVPALRPQPLAAELRADLEKLSVDGGPQAPAIDADWGEPGLSPVERLFGWNALEILAFRTGNPDAPVNAIPPSAEAVCQLRFVVGTQWQDVVPAVRAHLAARGYGDIEVAQSADTPMPATRLSSSHPAVRWAARSIERTLGRPPSVLPNLGGTIPNDAFAEILGMPTVWVPHSYSGCCQHAPNEHILGGVAREALQMMAGLWWDLGEADGPLREAA